MCGTKLSSNWDKPLCPDCVNSLVKESSLTTCNQMLSSFKDEMASTFQSFKGLIDRMQAPATSLTRASSTPSLQIQEEEEEIRDRTPRSVVSSQAGSASESEGEEDSSRAARYKLSLDDVGDLLNAIYDTLDIQEEQVQLSRHDLMYQGNATRTKVFPVHKSLIDMILREWEQPERRPFFSGSLKRRFPFESDVSHPWNKVPRLDAPLAKVSRRTDLAFDDLGSLRDPMDKRGDLLLKRAWDASAISLKPALAATCVARNLECWLTQLQAHILAGTSRQELLKSFPPFFKAVGFLADASGVSKVGCQVSSSC